MKADRNAWDAVLADPFRERFLADGPPDLEAMAHALPRPGGAPALDPDAVAREHDRLAARLELDLGHPLLTASVLTGLAAHGLAVGAG